MIIIILILLLIFYIISQYRAESFQPIGARLHVKLDGNCNTKYFSYQSPPDNGEFGCTIIQCPNKYSNYTCWSCCNY